jgi:hypothetical protein
MRAQFIGFYPESLLEKVRFRVGWPTQQPLQADVFGLLHVRAIALDNVIVFRDQNIADDPNIWAHELTHVQQYDLWGVDGFAQRYVRDHRKVETEAWEAAARYTMWTLEADAMARR